MKKTFMKARVKQGDSYVDTYIDSENLVTGKRKKLDKEMIDKLKDKIEQLEKKIKYLGTIIDSGKSEGEELDEWSILMVRLYRDELLMDLREDKDLVKYKGLIPKHIDERCKKKCTKTYDNYSKLLGRKQFLQLKEDVDVHCWGNVIIEQDKTSGGGKV
jgi:hypothetical protein